MEGPSNPMPQDDVADDDLINSVDREIQRIPPNDSEACIFKVHARLREVNPKAYEPTILAIGPYHHGKDNLSEMQHHKLRYLQLLLERRQESSAERYITAMRSLEEKARRCYANSINHLDESDDFVKMMLLDGCFIIELFRKWRFQNLRDKDDPIFKLDWMHCNLRRDLMLFENQLPFFILVELDNMTKLNRPNDNIIEIGVKFLDCIMPTKISRRISVDDSANHLLGLMHHCWCSPFAEMVSGRNVVNQERGGFNLEFMKSMTELQEAGIQFKKSSTLVFNIKFESGVMEIPPLKISNSTECVFRNLIAYEQYGRHRYKCVSDYAWFLDCLVNSAKDAEKLGHYGIINNWLGDHEAIATMLNKLSDHILIDSDRFCYLEVFNNVNKHCRRRRNILLANLRRNYFNTPWAIISFLAALVLLLLTLIQTIFSILG